MKIFVLSLWSILFPIILFAQTSSVTVGPGGSSIGSPTPPLKFYINRTFLEEALVGVKNADFKVTIIANNTDGSVVGFYRVQFFDGEGTLIGRDGASNNNDGPALSTDGLAFTFQNFNLNTDDLKKVAGLQVQFFPRGGTPSDTIQVASVELSLNGQSGESCITDPIIVASSEAPLNVFLSSSVYDSFMDLIHIMQKRFRVVLHHLRHVYDN